jgi:hypothetical protein
LVVVVVVGQMNRMMRLEASLFESMAVDRMIELVVGIEE